MNDFDRHSDHEALRDDLAAYSLGALPPEEALELGDHLRTCARCRELVLWLEPAVDVLPAAVPQLEPPPSLRENVMATVRAEAATSEPEPAGDPWWRRFSLPDLRPAIALAAVLLLAVGLGGGYALWGDGENGGAESSFVAAKPLSGNPHVSATLERQGESATLHVNELPELPPNQVYEVWIDRAGEMEPSTLFVLNEKGSGVAAIPGPLDGAKQVLVTAEPRGGSPQPTSPPLLSASL